MGDLARGAGAEVCELSGTNGCGGAATAAKRQRTDGAEERGPDRGLCWLCNHGLDVEEWWPLILVPLDFSVCSEEQKLCHFWCVQRCNRRGWKGLQAKFLAQVDSLTAACPELSKATPRLSFCHEEGRLRQAARGAALPLPDADNLPPTAWALQCISEIRVCTCPTLRELPAQIGGCRGLKLLVLISDAITELPPEVGELELLEHVFLNGNFLRRLPAAVGALPRLRELCLDANLLEELPPITGGSLELLSAPANRLVELPQLSGSPTRLEVNGNRLARLPLGVDSVRWDRLLTFKVMGNQLVELPAAVEGLYSLRSFNVAENRLKQLPRGLGQLRKLEWLFAYSNYLAELPAGVLGGPSIERALFESNPLSPGAVRTLLEEASKTSARIVGLDEEQVGSAREALPGCVSVGNVLPVGGAGQYFLRLARASRLRRARAPPVAGQRGGPAPEAAPARLLVVAFAASQGEPEWNGLLGRLCAEGRAVAQPPPAGPLSARASPEPLGGGGGYAKEMRLAGLWSDCSARADPAAAAPAAERGGVDLEDFDVLSVVDHRMRWYLEDFAGLHEALQRAVARYDRALFVGASMGGFGALLHGGLLAGAVAAFGPQAVLHEATLRPPGDDLQHLREKERALRRSVLAARSRGARLAVHCAADEHMWHALSMPLGDLAVTVHPLLPRKPFAKLLDRAGLLLPIVSGVVHDLLAGPAASPAIAPTAAPPPDAAGGPWQPGAGRALLACWGGRGRATSRYSAEPRELMELFFGEGSPSMPRPGDWFCPRCHHRNMQSSFFCHWCHAEGASDLTVCSIVNPQAAVVAGGKEYPKPGDWGCRACGVGMTGWQAECTHCAKAKTGDEAFIVT